MIRSFLRLFVVSAIALTGFVNWNGPLLGANPLGGLTVAVSNDGELLVAGGDTRTVLVLDPESLEVKERHWLGVSITGLAFNKDASVLTVQDTSDTIHFLSTADWSKMAELTKRAAFTCSAEADLLAGYDGSSGVFVHSLSDGSEKAALKLPAGVRVAALALSRDGKKLAVLSQGVKDPEEAEVPFSQLPKDLKGPELDELKQKSDGKTSQIFLFDAAPGELKSETKLYYSTGSDSKLLFEGESLLAITFTNLNARIHPDGETTLFRLEHSSSYGIGLSNDQSHILGGGMGGFSITKADTLVGSKGTSDRLPSWPEYWKGFCATPGATAIYGATTAYRVFQLDTAAQVVKSEPVR